MEKECCPKFDPAPWDGKVITWKDKLFVRDKVFCLFYMPINFGSVITRLMKKMDDSVVKSPEWMALSDHTSPFNMDIYVSVDKKLPGADNRTISGKFLSKVYDGPFEKTGEWCKDFQEYAKGRKLKLGKMYMWYTTCPKCAKKYGKNPVVIIAEIKG